MPEDLRVRRTRVALRNAVIELVEQHGFDRVTVAAICERAMVSRAGFYRHYRDKYQLVEHIFDDGAAVLVDGADEPGAADPATRLRRFFDHVAAHDRWYRVLLGPKGSPWFAARVHRSFTGMLDARLRLDEPGADLVATVLGGMLTHTLIWWLDHGRPMSSAALASYCTALAGAVVERAHQLPAATAETPTC
ncbi:TetR/AcrR family transcriptional regulator [Nocardia blacklockiae]|uniref:TetR/AcrR family transcriptional regulator n=1 Tax=Nocardia blacklockiae TaxID=480036 RepID=UPI001895FF27|nr:TetR/AcrR family transcriptional regulator [Nocardia blacklockiae]MBF6175015.1 TetR/AcrR family transcriptional regulator [Nocardia blacklockiae]